jgi:hypothetical protein
LIRIVQAFQIRSDINAASEALDTLSHRVAA